MPPPVILCIDDHVAGLKLRSEVLGRAGYTVLTATDGRAGLELLDSHHVGLVLTDHFSRSSQDSCRPSGTWLVGEIKSRKPGIRVVILSGATEAPTGTGAGMFVSKLEPVEEMLEKISEILSRGAN